MTDTLLEATTLPELVHGACERWPDHDLVVFDDQHLTYRDAESRSARLARQLLARGIGKGSHVGLLLSNSGEFVVSWLAINRIGAVGVPLSTLSTAAELRQLITHADLEGLIFQPTYLKHDYVERLESALPGLAAQKDESLLLAEAPFLRQCWVWSEEAPSWATPLQGNDLAGADTVLLEAAEGAVHPSDRGAIIYTSGSTGEPKGVVHSQASLLRQSIKQAREKAYTARDRIFSSMPFFWVGGLSYKLLPAMQAGAAVLGCTSAAPADILDFIEAQKVTLFLGWPHAAQALENDPSFADRDLTHLRAGYLFAARSPQQRPASLNAVCNALGMTETAGPHTRGHLSPLPEHLHGSFGEAAEGIEYRVVDTETGQPVTEGQTGELWVRGDTLMAGLYKREAREVFTTDGWYPTRDLVHLREGHLFFEGRCDDLVKIKGANVSPKEVEDVLATQTDVAQAIVSGVEHQGKPVLGAVVATRGDARVSPEHLHTALRQQLSAYKVPKLYLILPATQLPFRSSGKIDRRALLEQLAREGIAVEKSP